MGAELREDDPFLIEKIRARRLECEASLRESFDEQTGRVITRDERESI